MRCQSSPGAPVVSVQPFAARRTACRIMMDSAVFDVPSVSERGRASFSCARGCGVEAAGVYRAGTSFVSCVRVADDVQNVYAQPALALPVALVSLENRLTVVESLFFAKINVTTRSQDSSNAGCRPQPNSVLYRLVYQMDARYGLRLQRPIARGRAAAFGR